MYDTRASLVKVGFGDVICTCTCGQGRIKHTIMLSSALPVWEGIRRQLMNRMPIDLELVWGCQGPFLGGAASSKNTGGAPGCGVYIKVYVGGEWRHMG